MGVVDMVWRLGRSIGEWCHDPWSFPRSATWSRLLVAAALLALGAFLATPIVDEHRMRQAYLNASVCPAGDPRTTDGGRGAADCLLPGTGEVTDREIRRGCFEDDDGFPTCRRDHRLRITVQGRDDQDSRWFLVAENTYRDTARGDRVEVLLWQDTVVRLTASGHTETYEPYFGLRDLWWRTQGAWLALGLAVAVATGLLWALPFGWYIPLWLTPYILLGGTVIVVIEGVLFGMPLWVCVVAALGFAALSGGMAEMARRTWPD